MFHIKNKAFTLVELIVVVTILAILATIGFVSYSSYLTGVRDTNRLAQLVSIHDGLELYRTRNDLPLPDENVEVIIGFDPIAYQGYAGSNTLETIDFTKGGIDPRDKSYFSYYLTADRKYFQLMAFLEEEANITSLTPSPSPSEERGVYVASFSPKGEGIQGGGLFVSQVQAVDYSNRIPTIYGKKLGILTNDQNTPIQEIQTIKDNGSLTITSSTTGYIAHVTDVDILETTQLLSINPKANCKRIKQLKGGSSDGIYTINPTGAANAEFKVYCDMTTDGGGWMLILKADGTQSTFDYSSNYWTTSNILNENDIGYNQNEFKSSLYNTISFDNIMLELITDNKRNTITLGLSNSSVLNLMNGGITLTNFNKNEWVGLVEGGELQTNCNAQGINPNTSRVRIGMTSNNENDCSSNDSVLGIGITDGGAMSVGNYCNSTLCDGRATASSTSINSFGYLYIR